MNQTKPIFFLHIPKTGGVSLRTLISYNFTEDEICHVPNEELKNPEYARSLIGRYNFVHGHFNRLFVEPVLDQVDLFTFLRKPENRILSLYNFLRRQDPAKVADPEDLQRVRYAQKLSIEEFIAVRDNVMIGKTKGGMSKILGLGPNPEADKITPARELLAQTTFFGLCERFEESVQLLCHTMGWPPNPAPPKLNTTAYDRDIDASPGLRAALMERNREDIELYEYAVTLFEQRLQAMRSDRKTWRIRALQQVERYRGQPTAAGQLFDVGRPILASGWMNLEGSERPWRFSGPGPVAVIHCYIEREAPAELWALFHLPFFAQCPSPAELKITVNEQACRVRYFPVAQGFACWIRAGAEQLEADGLQRIGFDSSAADAIAPKAPAAVLDDRPIRFALTRGLCLLVTPADHPKFSTRLECIFTCLATPGDSLPAIGAAQEFTKRIADEHRWQPALSRSTPWGTPHYQRNRLCLAESVLPAEVPVNARQCLEQLYASDPALLAEILFVLFPHIEPAR